VSELANRLPDRCVIDLDAVGGEFFPSVQQVHVGSSGQDGSRSGPP
jgi:hypothetical protein